jgi:hypothetical protein
MTAAREGPATRLLVVATALVCALTVFPIILATLALGPLFYYHVLVLLADVPLAIACAAVLVVARDDRPGALVTIAALLCVALVFALALHPSPQGTQTVLRVLAAVLLAIAIVRLLGSPRRPLIVGAIGAGAIAQTAIAVLQVRAGAPLGMPWLGEFADPLYEVGGHVAARGTMYHHYLLAGLALVAAVLLAAEGLRGGRIAMWWTAATALAAIPIGLTYSRAGLAGLALAIAALAIGARARPRPHLLAIAAILAGAGIPSLLTFDAWTTQSEKSFEPNGRDILLREGLALYATEPLVGIGPGRMVIALADQERSRPGSVELLQPTHDVPILALVEGGPLAGVACTVLIAAAAWRARRSWPALALVGAYLPFVLLDHFPYTHAQGLVLSGVWLGAVVALGRDP